MIPLPLMLIGVGTSFTSGPSSEETTMFEWAAVIFWWSRDMKVDLVMV
jgi:hypothetical protein